MGKQKQKDGHRNDKKEELTEKEQQESKSGFAIFHAKTGGGLKKKFHPDSMHC